MCESAEWGDKENNGMDGGGVGGVGGGGVGGGGGGNCERASSGPLFLPPPTNIKWKKTSMSASSARLDGTEY